MSKLSETLIELMSDKNLSAKFLSEETGIPAPTITRYRTGTHTPTIKNLVILADYFNCSTDFLLGLETDCENITFKKCPPFCEQLNFLLRYANCNSHKFCKKYKIPESSFFEWKNATSIPTLDNIVKIAKALDRRVDFILGRES